MPFIRRRRKPVFVRTYGPRLTNKQKLGIWLIAFAVILIIVGAIFSTNMRSVITQMAVAKAYDIVTVAINEAINEKLNDGTLSYGQLITLEKDENGSITALVTDMASVNRLQAEIVTEVISRVSEMGSTDLSIPLGNIIGGNLLSGRGPGIPIRIISLTNSSAEFSNEFISAGINQTRHQILLEITVYVNILVPGYTTTTEVTTQVIVAETIIVGDVPNSYLNLQ